MAGVTSWIDDQSGELRKREKKKRQPGPDYDDLLLIHVVRVWFFRLIKYLISMGLYWKNRRHRHNSSCASLRMVTCAGYNSWAREKSNRHG